MPLARGGRELLLPLLKAQKGLTVWIYSSKLGCVYPPAWRARGVDLDRLYFVRNDGSLSALRALFLEPLFQCVVIDSPMKWRPEDLFFLRTAAKRNKFHLLLLRPFFLSNKKGNPLCRQRFNVSYHVKQKSYRVHKLKGPNLGTYWINREALFKCH